MPIGLFRRKSKAVAALTEGRRVYAIGDVHGRIDLLDPLLAQIAEDDAARDEADTTVILLGDLIDRGRHSSEVVSRVMAPLAWTDLICLKGNHEAAMTGALGGDDTLATMWLRNGGVEALSSWGVSAQLLAEGQTERIMAAAREAIPREQQRWIAELPISYSVGDYFFVHAGVRPNVPLMHQTEEDQLWIRDDFLHSNANHGKVIVHGHSITEDIVDRNNRICVDTGAYLSGRLSCVGLQGEDRWFVYGTK